MNIVEENVVEVWQVDDSGNKMVPTVYKFGNTRLGVDTAIWYYVQTLKVKDCIDPVKVFVRSVTYYPETVYCYEVSAKLHLKYCSNSSKGSEI